MPYVTGWGDIGRVFGVSAKSVKAWRTQGAPVLLLGSQPVTNLDALWSWLVEHRQKVEQNPDTTPPSRRPDAVVHAVGGLPVRGMSAAQAKRYVMEHADGHDDGTLALLTAICHD